MFGPATSAPKLSTLIILTGISVLSLNMFLPSLGNMADDLGVTYAQASLAVSGYMAVTAGLQIIAGPLADRFGRRPILLGSAVIFILASLGAALAEDFTTFMVFRILQGATISSLALTRAIVRDMAAPREAARLLGVMGTVMALAPMFGPMIGGVLEAGFGWRSNFFFFCILGLLSFWLIWTDLGETNTNTDRSFSRQFKAYPALIRNPRFWGYTMTMTFSVGAFYSFLAGAPYVATQIYGLDPSQAGLALGAPPVGFMLGNILTGRFANNVPLARLATLGRVVTAVGMGTLLLILTFSPVPAPVFFGFCAFIGMGNGLSLPPASAGAMSVNAKLAGSASGLSGAMSVGGAAILSAITGAMVSAGGMIMLPAAIMIVALLGVLAGLFTMRAERLADPTPA